MRGEELERSEGPALRSFAPRVVPNAAFVQSLGDEIRRMASQDSEPGSHTPFAEVVVEMRKLVRLLARTLVPVRPSAEFARALGGELHSRALQVTMVENHRRRWLMVGSVVGSLLSVLGLVTALLLWRRNGRWNTPKSTMGTT